MAPQPATPSARSGERSRRKRPAPAAVAVEDDDATEDEVEVGGDESDRDDAHAKRRRVNDAEDADTGSRDGESEMGIIEEIYCENFMCHRRMQVALSPHINFITGENGSGKSAIIAAIQVCQCVCSR